MANATVGVAGLGAMGMGTALALLDAGFTVAGYDIDAAKLASFAKAGGIACDRPVALAEHSDSGDHVGGERASRLSRCCSATRGSRRRLSGGLLIQAATVGAGLGARSGYSTQAAGIELLDSPVSGGQVRAREGELSVMLSGPVAAARTRAADIYEAAAANRVS